jgi:GNAT superfamily N-acetyltransferase
MVMMKTPDALRPLPPIKGYRWKVEPVEDWPHAGSQWYAYLLTPDRTRVAYLTIILYGDWMLLRYLFVHQAYRGRGLGGLMLRSLLLTYPDIPIRLKVEPDTDDRPLDASQLTAWYSRLGFVIEAGAPWMVRPGVASAGDADQIKPE